MADVIYKICTEQAFSEARAHGRLRGSSDDLRDGFIHLSTAEQLIGTLEKHFAGRSGLMLLAIDAGRLGDDLRWEPSRGGELFPHLYAPLEMDRVLSAEPLVLEVNGRHRLPVGVLL